MSYVEVVNDKDEVIGKMLKADAHKDGTLHRISVVYVENLEGEILIQIRADGYLDHSAAGHVEVGESYEQAAERELEEELGIKKETLQFIGHGQTKNERYPDRIVSHVFDVFKCVAEPQELQADEVKGVYWADPYKVVEEMRQESNKFCMGFIESLKIYLSNRENH
jgi:16S rRNA (adenine1518-N6/adenine1519-N6)-dimethyltransferase